MCSTTNESERLQDDSLSIKSFQFTWEIPEYNKRKLNCKINESIKSKTFSLSCGGQSPLSCTLYFFPKGDRRSSKTGETAIFSKTQSQGKYKNSFHFTFSILDARREVFISRFFHEEVPHNSVGVNFIPHGHLDNPTNNLLLNDTLTIYCQAWETISKSDTCDCKNDFQILRNRCHLVTDFAKLLEDKVNSDVHLKVKDEDVPAHKLILAARSPVFAAMFQNDMLESKTNEVEIADVEPVVLKALLEFIYTGDCVVGNLAEGLFRAADKYNIKDLKEMCEQELQEKITVDNAVHLLIISDLYQAKKLKESVTLFINCCAADVMEKPSWNKLMDSYPRLVGELYMKAFGSKREEK